MDNNKLFIIYKKKINSYLIIDSNNKVIWQFNLNNEYNNNKNLKLSRKMNKYIFFLLNISIFGLCPINNYYEFKKK